MQDGARTTVAKGKLGWVEAGRGVAAFLVMLSHIYIVHPVPLDTYRLGLLGSYGVGFFFVLSGYIMCHVHWRDIGRPRTVPHFVWRRLVRIFPTYLFVFLLALAINLLLQKVAWRVHPTPYFLVSQMFLLPGDPLFVGPAWTLRHELFFYAVFALLLLNRWLGLAALAAWGLLLAWHFASVGMVTGAADRAPDIYLHHLNLAFFEGLALGLAERRGALLRFAAINALAAALLFGLHASGWTADPRVAEFALFPLFGALLGLLVWTSEHVATPRMFVWLGAISYALYLVHITVYNVLRGVDHVAGRPLDPVWPVRVLLQLAIATVAAGLLYHFYERPVLRWLGRRPTILGISVARPERASA